MLRTQVDHHAAMIGAQDPHPRSLPAVPEVRLPAERLQVDVLAKPSEVKRLAEALAERPHGPESDQRDAGRVLGAVTRAHQVDRRTVLPLQALAKSRALDRQLIAVGGA